MVSLGDDGGERKMEAALFVCLSTSDGTTTRVYVLCSLSLSYNDPCGHMDSA